MTDEQKAALDTLLNASDNPEARVKLRLYAQAQEGENRT